MLTAAPTRVRRAFRVHDPEATSPARWLALAGAVASWPGAPVTVERRWITPGVDALLVEMLVVTLDGADVLGPASVLQRDAGLLAHAVLAGTDHEPQALDDEVLNPAIGDVAEVRRLHRDTRWPAARESVGAALGGLASECGRAALSILIASPALGTSGPADHEPALRCRVRLSAERMLPVGAIAHAGALVGALPHDWVRPHGEVQLARARRAALASAAHLWGTTPPNEDPDPATPVEAAAALLATPVAVDSLRRHGT